jgi:hypothetical protein
MDGEGKRRRGRPKADREASAFKVTGQGETVTFNIPRWWFAMAQLEGEWRAKGKWVHGSKGDLARHFTPTGSAADGKSNAAVTKARKDIRYQALVARAEAEWRRQLEEDCRNPTATEAARDSIRGAIEAAMKPRADDPGVE